MRFDPPIPFADYLLTERVGVGGTAEIFAAVRRGRAPGEPAVAIKRLLPHIAADAWICELLMREVGALSRITHPAVVRLLDHGQVGPLPFLVLEFVGGQTLRRVLGRAPDKRVFPAAVVIWLAGRIAAGLHAAWQHGVVHRDVSPTNIQITPKGEPKIIDFGLARVRGMVQTTHGQGLKGKWAYLAPEQIEGVPLDGRADLFALGSVLYELLVGTPPFRGANREDTLRRVREHDLMPLPRAPVEGVEPADLPPGMPRLDEHKTADFVGRLLAHDRQDRPADGLVVARMADDVLGGSSAALDEQMHTYLAGRVAAVTTVAQLWAPSAAELRGETVTDPAGETVTAVGIERAGQPQRADHALD